MAIDKQLRRLVRRRARSRCEYCFLPMGLSRLPFEVDHIVSRKHAGESASNNLALACFYCNSFKGPNIASIDHFTRKVVGLYNPRRQRWSRHFRWVGFRVVGKTPCGRATTAVLQLNAPEMLHLREELAKEGAFPFSLE